MQPVFQHLALERPLTFVAVNTTGPDPQTDRIVSLALRRFEPGAPPRSTFSHFNPGQPIAAAATAAHGLTGRDVEDWPAFERLAVELAESLQDSDLAGFDLKRVGLPFLRAEFVRAGVPFSAEGCVLVDLSEIYRRQLPHDLEAAVRFYLGRAHGFEGSVVFDTIHCAEILDAQLGRDPSLPRTPASLKTLLGAERRGQ